MNYIDMFLEALSAERGRSQRTLSSYASDLRLANDSIPGGLMGASGPDIQKYLDELDERPSSVARKASALRFDGEKFRAEEMKIFFERTILNPEYAGEKNWLIMGDTNSISPLDDRYYGYGLKSPFYWGHNYVLGTSSCIDLVKQYCCPGERDVMIPSTQSGRRIDIMYGTQVMAERVIKVKTPREGFTKSIKRAGFRFHERSSDHLPVIVDFKWR